MTTRPPRLAQTTAEAKRDYKKNGPRMRDDELRRLQRGVELEQRAARLRKQEEQRRIGKQKRLQKEQKEREARRQLGIGIATQMVGYSHTQRRMKSGMEAFVGLKKGKTKTKDTGDTAVDVGERQEEGVLNHGDEEDFGLVDLPELDSGGDDSFIDDDLDDQTLMELEASTTAAAPLPPPKPPLEKYPSPTLAVGSTDRRHAPFGREQFDRLHGPVNKALEMALRQFPTFMFESISLDMSLTRGWSPPESVLHHFNPPGVPPHRLRLKKWVIISLLQDYEFNGTHIASSTLLKVLDDRGSCVECAVLVGPLRRTRVLISPVLLRIRYQNNSDRIFGRMQYPLCVSISHIRAWGPDHTPGPPATFSRHLRSGPSRPPPGEAAASGTSRHETSGASMFKLPGLPASKLPKSPPAQEPMPDIVGIGQFEDYFESGSQIARELSEGSSPCRQTAHQAAASVNSKMPGGRQDNEIQAGVASGPISRTATGLQSPFSKASAKYHSTIVPTVPSEPLHSLGEFGLSTQDVMAFFDDDDNE